MTVILNLTVAGDPVAKGRPKFDTRSGRTYTPARTQTAQDAMAWALRNAHTGTPEAGPVRLTMKFRCKTRRRCDIDNLAKLVLDAGNGIVWEDDQQVEALIVEVDRGCAFPETVIRVETR